MAEIKGKSKTFKIVVVIAIIVVLLIIGGICGFLYYQNKQLKKSTGTTWGDTYYSYLKSVKEADEEKIKEVGLTKDITKVDMQYVQVKDEVNPEMILSYEKDNQKYTNIYYIIDDTTVNVINYSNPTELNLLYNRQTNEYEWYIHSKENEQEIYKSLYKALKEAKNDSGSEQDTTYADYTFNQNEIESKFEVAEGEIPEVSKFDQTFIKTEYNESNVAEINFEDKDKELKENVTKVVSEYKTKEQIQEEVKAEVEEEKQKIEEKETEIETLKEEKRKAEEMKITQSNVVEKLGEHLKYFAGCYLGDTYGIGTIYKLNEVTGSINVPGINSSYEMTYEVVGLKSISSLNELFKKYIAEDVISKLKRGSSGDITRTLHDYNGKVYWGMGGIGDGPNINYKKAKVLSSEGDTSTIQLENINVLGNVVTERITVTVKYDEETSAFKITDYSVKNLY